MKQNWHSELEKIIALEKINNLLNFSDNLRTLTPFKRWRHEKCTKMSLQHPRKISNNNDHSLHTCIIVMCPYLHHKSDTTASNQARYVDDFPPQSSVSYHQEPHTANKPLNDEKGLLLTKLVVVRRRMKRELSRHRKENSTSKCVRNKSDRNTNLERILWLFIDSDT